MFNDSLKVFPVSVDFVPHCWVGFAVQREAFLQTSKNWSFGRKDPLPKQWPCLMLVQSPGREGLGRSERDHRWWGWVQHTINHLIPWLILQLLPLSVPWRGPSGDHPSWADTIILLTVLVLVIINQYICTDILHISLVILIYLSPSLKNKTTFLMITKSVPEPGG